MESIVPEGEWGILTESGIVSIDDEIITSGKLVDVARKLKGFWENKNYKAIIDILGEDGLSAEDSNRLSHTVIPGYGASVIWMLDHALDAFEEMEG